MIEGYLQRRAMRNLYLIRDQTVSVLGMVFRLTSSFDLKTWIENSAPFLSSSFTQLECGNDYKLGHEDLDDSLSKNYKMLLNVCISAHEQSCAQSDEEMGGYSALMGSIPAQDYISDDTHTHELHIEWDVEDFVLSGAIMHILCTLEELERGLLRILCLYGTQQKSGQAPRTQIHPTLRDLSKSPPEWEDAANSKSIYSVSGRHAILKSYFINAEPDSDWNDRLWSIRTDRNTLARAVSTLRYPFQSFLQVHYDAYRAVRHLAEEAMTFQGIVL